MSGYSNMTNQEIFNRVAKHLLTQNAQSVLDGSCAYRGYDGTKCAVGVLIPAKKYSTAMEGKNVTFINRNYNLGLGLGNSMNMLITLQGIHDYVPTGLWPRELDIVMKRHKLTAPPILKKRLAAQ